MIDIESQSIAVGLLYSHTHYSLDYGLMIYDAVWSMV